MLQFGADFFNNTQNYTHTTRWFYPTEFSNTSAQAKRPLKAEVLIDREHPYIFTIPNTSGTGRVLQGLIDQETGLLVLNNSKKGAATALLHKRALETVAHDFHEEVSTWSPAYADTQKDERTLERELTRVGRRWSDVTSKINAQIAQLPTNAITSYNTRCIYQGEVIHHDINNLEESLITERMPISNPSLSQTLDTKRAEKFLDVFFDFNDRETFSWYMGAALLNKDIDDETVSRALVLLSPGGGRGKTTLVDLMTHQLFPEDFVDRHGSFDTVFATDNKFGTSSIKNRRLVVFNEATWGVPNRDGVNMHNMNGLNQGAMKTVWGDGIVDAEQKFQDLEYRDAKGLHIICSNFVPILGTETNIKLDTQYEVTGALARRILPCMLKPTSMNEKGRQLGMTRHQMAQFVKEHALEFAVLFTRTYMENPSKFVNYSYDAEFLSDIELQQAERTIHQESVREAFKEQVEEDLLKGMMLLDEFINVNSLMLDIVSDSGNCRVEGDTLYINSSASYLNRFGDGNIRKLFKSVFPIEKRFGMRMFIIKLRENEIEFFADYQKAFDDEKEANMAKYKELVPPTDKDVSGVSYDANKYARERYSRDYYNKYLAKSFDEIAALTPLTNTATE